MGGPQAGNISIARHQCNSSCSESRRFGVLGSVPKPRFRVPELDRNDSDRVL